MFRYIFILALVVTLPCFAQYQRRTPVVEAVQKTKAGIVALNVTKNNRPIKGTGIIVDAAGYVVTNYHVVQDCESISVKTALGKEYSAELVRTFSKRDLALLKIQSQDKFTALEFANSEDVLVGETIIAVGNPYGFSNTVSTGIVSAVKREIPGPTDAMLDDVIQHSANINPGNSGGPLLNINGELIGINVAIKNGAQGISFAISADTVKRVVVAKLNNQIQLTASR